MITVPEAARRVGRDPETVRRWIRQGKLPSRRIGTQHLIEEDDLLALADRHRDMLPLPSGWGRTHTGEPMPDWVAVVRRDRAEH